MNTANISQEVIKIKPPILGAYDTTKKFLNKISAILNEREFYLDKTTLDVVKINVQKLLVRAYGTDKISLPLTISSEDLEKWSDLVSIVVWNKDEFIEYVNYGYIKATGLDRLTQEDWVNAVGQDNATLNIIERIRFLSKEKVDHPKFGKVTKLYSMIYDDEALEDVLGQVVTLDSKGKGYKDRVFKMKITGKYVMWNSKNNDLSGGSVRTGVDVTEIEGFDNLLKNNEESVSSFNFKKNVTDFFRLFKNTAETAIIGIGELLIYGLENPKNNNSDTRGIKKAIIGKIGSFPGEYTNDTRKKIAERIATYKSFNGEDDDEMDIYRYVLIEEIREKLSAKILKNMGLTDERKKEIAVKMGLGPDAFSGMTSKEKIKENEKKVLSEIFKTEKNLDAYNNFLLRELFTLTQKIEEVESDLTEVEKYANIGDIIVDYGPLMIYMFHDDEYFYNNRYLNVMGLSQMEVNNLFFNGGFSYKVYGGETHDKFKDKMKKMETGTAITQQMEITRENLEKVGVLWNAHKCTNAGSSVWIGMLTK